jgi:hypothetical protein
MVSNASSNPIHERGRTLFGLVLMLAGSSLGLAACGDGKDQAATAAPDAKAAAAGSSGKVASRILAESEFKTTIVNRAGLKPKPTERQLEIERQIEAAYAAVPKKDLMQVNMLISCESRSRGRMVPFDQKASAIAIAQARIRAVPTAGADCLKASFRRS